MTAQEKFNFKKWAGKGLDEVHDVLAFLARADKDVLRKVFADLNFEVIVTRADELRADLVDEQMSKLLASDIAALSDSVRKTILDQAVQPGGLVNKTISDNLALITFARNHGLSWAKIKDEILKKEKGLKKLSVATLISRYDAIAGRKLAEAGLVKKSDDKKPGDSAGADPSDSTESQPSSVAGPDAGQPETA